MSFLEFEFGYLKLRMHVPVLLQQTIDGLNLKQGDIFVDATLGGGGHSQRVCEIFGNNITMIGIDRDGNALNKAIEVIAKTGCKMTAKKGNFRDLDLILDELKISKIDKILLDLGISSNQFEESGRGFSYQ